MAAEPAIGGLEPGERVICHAMVRLRAATSIAALTGAGPTAPPRPGVGGALGLGAGAGRRRSRLQFPARARAAEAAGFPIPAPEFILGVTDHGRVLVWRSQFVRSRPGRFGGVVDLARVAQVATTRRLGRRGLAVVSGDTVLELQPLNGRRVLAVAEAFAALVRR